MTATPKKALRAPSGGTAPPQDAVVGGVRIHLGPLARAAAEEHVAAFPDERARYGDAVVDWCAHDLQWTLAWAAAGEETCRQQLAWLRDLLAARHYPVDRFERGVELAAAVAERDAGPAGASVAAVLRRALAAS